MKLDLNRLANVNNPWQGSAKKVLCVCSAGLLRSPTTAQVLSADPYNFNTRAVGIDQSFALTPLDPIMLVWADEVVCFSKEQRNEILDLVDELDNSGILDRGFNVLYTVEKEKIHLWDVPDNFGYRDPELIKTIRDYANKTWGVTSD